MRNYTFGWAGPGRPRYWWVNFARAQHPRAIPQPTPPEYMYSLRYILGSWFLDSHSILVFLLRLILGTGVLLGVGYNLRGVDDAQHVRLVLVS